MYSVVIADDESKICDGIKAIISTALPECEVTHIYRNGNLLYDHLLSHQPDILLIDIEMPGKSGLDIARLIDEQQHKSYVIIITAHHNFEYAKAAIDYRVDAFITKPFSSAMIIEVIQKAMSHIAKRNSKSQIYMEQQRTLIHCQLDKKAVNQSLDSLLLCNGTAHIDELLCTEIVITDNALVSFPDEKQAFLLHTLRSCGESDTSTQSSFLVDEACTDCLTFLVFSKGAPKLEFVSKLLEILSNYTGGNPKHTFKTYPSFSVYTLQRSFSMEMNLFFDILTSDGSHQAKKQLSDYLHSLANDERHHFAQYLSEKYHADMIDTTTDAIVHSMDRIINSLYKANSGQQIVDRAKKYIQDNFASNSLSQYVVSDALDISNAYLSRIFTKYTGQTFSEYLLRFRMEQAKQLLKTTELSTIEIAKSVGYYNPEYFRTSFKTYSGMTPRQFRMLRN